MENSLLTHLNQQGEAHMVDISHKSPTSRSAQAEAYLEMNVDTFQKILQGYPKKGDIFAAARIAGIMASKKTSDLIPLCHPLSLTHCEIDLIPEQELNRIRILATCHIMGQTGIEMEALVAASTSALTLYDMCKSLQKDMMITGIRLLKKTGGNSGSFEANLA